MKLMMISLATAFLLPLAASASGCDDYEYGSREWWECVTEGGGGQRLTTMSCEDVEFGSPEWWDCVGHGGGGEHGKVSACTEYGGWDCDGGHEGGGEHGAQR